MTQNERQNSPFSDVWCPEDDLMAVIDDRDDAARAVGSFSDAGWAPGDILVMSGHAVEERLDATGEQCHFISHVLQSLPSTETQEDKLFGEFEEQAREGHSIIAIHTHEGRGVEEAREILVQHNAHDIVLFGEEGAIRTLSEAPPKN